MTEQIHHMHEANAHHQSVASAQHPTKEAGFVLNETPVLSEIIHNAVANYLDKLGGTPSVGLYDLVIETVEEPLLQIIMSHTHQNQVQAAKLLGIARGTLRARLKKYGMIDSNAK